MCKLCKSELFADFPCYYTSSCQVMDGYEHVSINCHPIYGRVSDIHYSPTSGTLLLSIYATVYHHSPREDQVVDKTKGSDIKSLPLLMDNYNLIGRNALSRAAPHLFL